MKSHFIIWVFLLWNASVFASPSNYTLTDQLEDFHRDPARYMARLPVKSGHIASPFSDASINSGEFLASKDRFRKTLCLNDGNRRFCPQLAERSFVPYAAIDTPPQNIEAFVEGGAFRDARILDGIREMKVKQTPWSDTYWPLNKGALGQRYADPGFPAFGEWIDVFNYASKLDIFAENPKDRLAPSEKYDVLVGDRQKTLTQMMWAQGRYYHETYGTVERWMGLCHGWAPASYMLPRPTHAVTVQAADSNEPIKFVPSDIKGLATLLWASGNQNTLFLGGRCTDKNPKVDENGRILDGTCFDVNPGLFHILLINRIRQSRPFIFDASYDYEVWNQPVLGYSYTYFNPQTLEQADTLELAHVPIDQYARDQFKRYRSPHTKYVIGINMRVYYLVETQPTPSETNSPQEDSSIWTQYMYDLELDENRNIIGGEWYNNAHPDFVWTPQLNARAMSIGDYQLQESWTPNQPVPASWKNAAVRASRNSQPLAHVVESLLRWAQ
ncbi:MAG: hypothetical protein ABL958_10350 [Bdellovibrionia bacterium]